MQGLREQKGFVEPKVNRCVKLTSSEGGKRIKSIAVINYVLHFDDNVFLKTDFTAEGL